MKKLRVTGLKDVSTDICTKAIMPLDNVLFPIFFFFPGNLSLFYQSFPDGFIIFGKVFLFFY